MGDVDREELPLLTHTTVLGVDIAVEQRATESGSLAGAKRREAVQLEIDRRPLGLPDPVRRGLAAWARRNLFGGAP